VKGLKDKLDLYAVIIYMFYYILILFELLLFSFADVSVLPHADDPQVCSIFFLNFECVCSVRLILNTAVLFLKCL